MATEVVTIELGTDSFQAHIIAETCRAEGLKVELLTMDQSSGAIGMAPLVPHRLLVAQSAAARVIEIVADFGFGESG